MSKERTSMSRKIVGFTILAIIGVFGVGLAFAMPMVIDKIEDRANEEILENMEKIYTSAIIVDEIDVGLHEDSDNAGKYEKLSEMSGIRVYNAPQKKKYSVMKDYKTNEIKVYYGKNLVYPEETGEEPEEVNSVDIQNEDLFTYDESTGDIIITGFSEAGVSLLGSDNAIHIPDTYKGREVVGIAEKAFYNKGIVGVVVIGKNIRKIEDNAFSNNGKKGASDSIEKPYTGSWKVEDKEWVKVK